MPKSGIMFDFGTYLPTLPSTEIYFTKVTEKVGDFWTSDNGGGKKVHRGLQYEAMYTRQTPKEPDLDEFGVPGRLYRVFLKSSTSRIVATSDMTPSLFSYLDHIGGVWGALGILATILIIGRHRCQTVRQAATIGSSNIFGSRLPDLSFRIPRFASRRKFPSFRFKPNFPNFQ